MVGGLPLSQVSPYSHLFSVVLRLLEWERWDPAGPPDSLRTMASSRVRLGKISSQVSIGLSQ